MSKVRYFKASNGKITVFRASPSRVYLSATHFPDWRGFVLHWDGRGPIAVTEIDRKEYKALIALKQARFARERAEWIAANPVHDYVPSRFNGDAPSDSWVANSELPAAQPSSVEG